MEDLSALLERCRQADGGRAIAPELLDAIAAFVAGPAVVAVTGDRARSLSHLAESLARDCPGARVRQDVPPGDLLVDGVVVATPAAAVLSSAELQRVQALRQRRTPVWLAVTDADRFGAQRAAAEREIRELRLRPLLEPLGVECWFLDGGTAPSALADAVGALSSRAPACHVRPAAEAIARAAREGLDAHADRVAARDRAEALFHDLEAQGPADLSHLREAERLAALKVRDAVREAYERVLSAAGSSAEALAAWRRAQCPGDGSSATAALSEAWRNLGEALSTAVGASVASHASEVERVATRFDSVAVALDYQPAARARKAASHAQRLGEAIAALCATDVDSLVRAAVALARNDLQGSAKSAPGQRAAAAEPRRKPDAPRNVVDRARSAYEAVRSAAVPLPLVDRLRATLLQGIRTMLDERIERFVELASGSARADAEQITEEWLALRGREIAGMRAALDARHAWTSLYGDLSRILASAEELQRGSPA